MPLFKKLLANRGEIAVRVIRTCRVLHLSEPVGPGIRVDSGLDAGSEVSVHYDPLLSKIITWGQGRPEAIERMRDALRRTVVLGVVTNLARLRAIVEHPAFAAGELHTGRRPTRGRASGRGA